MARRETYATTGPGIGVRFFGGWHYPADLCDSPDLVARGYADGVPMGGQMEARPSGSGGPPTFLISALKDPGSASRPGTDLQLIQVVKGWLDKDGKTNEKVYDVAWSGDRKPGTDGRGPAGGNTVDGVNATWTNTTESAELGVAFPWPTACSSCCAASTGNRSAEAVKATERSG